MCFFFLLDVSLHIFPISLGPFPAEIKQASDQQLTEDVLSEEGKKPRGLIKHIAFYTPMPGSMCFCADIKELRLLYDLTNSLSLTSCQYRKPIDGKVQVGFLHKTDECAVIFTIYPLNRCFYPK